MNWVASSGCEEEKNGIVSALLALEAAALGGSRNASAVAGIATPTVEYMTLLTRACARICSALVVAVGDPPCLQRQREAGRS